MGTTRYKRVCCMCGSIKEVVYKPNDNTKCAACSRKELGYSMSQKNIKLEEDKIRYTTTCTNCGKVSISNSKRKTKLCGRCSTMATGKANAGRVKPKYFRICPKCPEDSNTIEVSCASNSGIKPCKKHKVVPNGENRKSVTSYKARVRTAEDRIISREKEINRKHRELENKRESKKVIPQTRTDEEMIAEFLSKNTITRIE